MPAGQNLPGLGDTMEDMGNNSDHMQMHTEKLWRAVIASTVEEWIHGPLRRKREAEQFLFHDEKDYKIVCSSAGIDAATLRAKLSKIRSRNEHMTDAQSVAGRN